MKLERQQLLDDVGIAGRAWCEASAALVDGWLAQLLDDAAGTDLGGVALAAVGGYGRGELCPQSDIDVVLLHDGRSDIASLAEKVWYPIWDAGLKLGHSVRTPKEALTLADSDLDTATSLLSTRHVAGDEALTDQVAGAALAGWQKRGKRWLERLAVSVEERHARAGEVAFLLEPDLKEARGGLRDVHALAWASAARTVLFDDDGPSLDRAYGTLLDARVELHRRTGRPGDTLTLQEQDGVAAALAWGSADELMRAVATAARTIAWTSDDTWDRIVTTLRAPMLRRTRKDRALEAGLVLRDGEVHVLPEANPAADPSIALRAAARAAEHGTRIDRASLDRLALEAPELPDPWPEAARTGLVDLLLAGAPAVPVIEALDQKGIWCRLLPEWAPNRSRPQRNAYHRFTVDRHLVEAAVGASRLVERVDRPDLLVLGALLHDIGKGYPGDHTVVGMELVAALGARMGLPDADVAVLVAMVEHHLLLPDVATRRDLDDPETAASVARAVRSERVLTLLHALTEADSLATGPSAWGGWKAALVRDLVQRVSHVLAGGHGADQPREEFPSPEHLVLMAAKEPVVEGIDDVLTVVTPDRPGVFATTAAVLALHGLAVREAAAYSDEEGVALCRFRVESSYGPVVPWDRVRADLELAFGGRLALRSRLDDKARTYRKRSAAGTAVQPAVSIDNRASATATVIDVQAPDSVGLLHRVASALAEMHLDIRSAKVSTVGHQVVDAFYVRGDDGRKVTDQAYLEEIERAVLHAIRSAPG